VLMKLSKMKTQDLVQEITARENQQTMPRTWGAWKYMATMYYQGVSR
jgi:hypothetical protein